MGLPIRLYLPLGIEPWFIPIGDPWRNGVVEKFNLHWRQRFLRHTPMGSMPSCSAKACASNNATTRTTATASSGASRRWP